MRSAALATPPRAPIHTGDKNCLAPKTSSHQGAHAWPPAAILSEPPISRHGAGNASLECSSASTHEVVAGARCLRRASPTGNVQPGPPSARVQRGAVHRQGPVKSSTE